MPDRLNLAPRHRRVLNTLLREHLPNTEVWAYGSRVNGRGHEGSDLDLVLRGPGLKKISLERLMDFEEAIRGSTIPILVEARDWARLPERFRREIEREYVVVSEGRKEPRLNWPRSCIGDLVSVHKEQITPSSFHDDLFAHYSIPAYDARQVPLVESGSQIKSNKFTVPSDAVLVSKLNPRFPRVWSPDIVDGEPAICSTEFLVLCPGRLIDRRFLHHLCMNPSFRASLLERVTGTSGSHQRVSPQSVLEIEVSVPPLPEQRAIAHILGTLDDKIELNRRMNETLEAMARALFKSWFVDFDPVRANVDGRDAGLQQDIADLFPGRLVDSEMGEIPEGWEVASLAERIDVNPKRPLRKGQAAPYLPMAKMPTRGHMPDSVAVRPFGSGMRFTNGDTLVARITPCLENGKTAYVDFLTDGEIGWGSTEYIVLRPQPPLPNQFAYCLARSARFREFAIRNMSGTSGRQRVPPTALRGFLLVVPPGRVAARFGKVAASLFERASNTVHESRTLAALRDALLPKLISGEIRLSETAWTLGMTDR